MPQNSHKFPSARLLVQEILLVQFKSWAAFEICSSIDSLHAT